MPEYFLSRWFHPSRKPKSERPGLVFRMFVEDIYTRITPFRVLPSEKPRQAIFEGNQHDARVATHICAELGRLSSAHDTPTDIVCDAVRSVAQQIAFSGRAAYAILDAPAATVSGGEDRVAPYRVRPLLGQRLFRLPGRILGVATTERRRWSREEAKVSIHRPDRVWLVSMPQSLGGRHGYRRLIRRLERYPLTLPEWASRSLATEHERVRFEVSSYARLREAYVARSSGVFGWNGRRTTLEYQTEFFLFYQTVTFHRALAQLRDHVVAKLNALFRKQLRIDAQIVLKGFPDPEDVLRVRDRMARGELSLGEAYASVTF